MAKLLVLDGNSLLHRAYYALPDWRNRSGEATAGVYGFLSILLKTSEELKPSHLAVVFDCPAPTFRHLMYVGYQTNREKDRQISDDIWGQVEKLKIVFTKMDVPVFAVPGFEADDVIGTLATQAKKTKGAEVVIETGDRDMMQLVGDQVKLFMPVKGITDGQLVNADKVKERLGILPRQVIDYKGLVGDSSDNYPGVTGIGPKTAISLLEEYGSLEGIYKKLDNVKETTRQKLIDGHESAMLSQTLATIKTDAPVTLSWDKCTLPATDKVVEVLKELGHKSLIRRVAPGEESKVNQAGLFD